MDKDRVDALLELAKFRMEHRKERRQQEWRVSLGVWAFLGVGIASKIKINECLLGVMLMAVIFCHAVFWVRSNYWRNERDARIAYGHIRMIEKNLNLPENSGHEPSKWGWILDGPPLFEILATVGISIVWLVVNSNQR